MMIERVFSVRTMTSKARPRAAASFGVPAPIRWRIRSPRLVAGNVNEVALVDVLAASEPAPPHAAALEGVGEGSLDDLGAFSHRRLADPGA
jgi:hypothetical protein